MQCLGLNKLDVVYVRPCLILWPGLVITLEGKRVS